MSTLVEAIVPRRQGGVSRVVYGAGLAVGGSLLVAGLAQVSIRLPFTPVPITGQTLGVLLVGASLGPALGAASLLLYLAEGAMGLPCVAGGCLWGFVLAAALSGWLSRLGWDRSIRSSIGAMFLGEVVLYGIGVPWLMSSLGVPLEKGLEFGLYPFVIGDTLKLLAAAAL